MSNSGSLLLPGWRRVLLTSGASSPKTAGHATQNHSGTCGGEQRQALAGRQTNRAMLRLPALAGPQKADGVTRLPLAAVPITSLMKCEADAAHVSTAVSAEGAAARVVEPRGVEEAGASAPGRQWQRRCRRQQRAGPLAPQFLPQHAPEVSEQQTTVAKPLQHIFSRCFNRCLNRVGLKAHYQGVFAAAQGQGL